MELRHLVSRRRRGRTAFRRQPNVFTSRNRPSANRYANSSRSSGSSSSTAPSAASSSRSRASPCSRRRGTSCGTPKWPSTRRATLATRSRCGCASATCPTRSPRASRAPCASSPAPHPASTSTSDGPALRLIAGVRERRFDAVSPASLRRRTARIKSLGEQRAVAVLPATHAHAATSASPSSGSRRTAWSCFPARPTVPRRDHCDVP